MTWIASLFIVVLAQDLSHLCLADDAQNSFWSWECIEDKCIRTSKPRNILDNCLSSLQPLYPSLPACRLVCGQYGALWPRPTQHVEILSTLHHLNPYKISYESNNTAGSVASFTQENIDLFRKNILGECLKSTCKEEGLELRIKLGIRSSDVALNWKTDESYHLHFEKKDGNQATAEISAASVFGMRHGLETFSQLIAGYSFSNEKCGTVSRLVVPEKVSIKDKPVYKHRGLLLDSGRNFLSVRTIKRQINGMAASKMNVLHWHATDSQSFPLQSTRVPQLTRYGAYSSSKMYTPQQVADILQYAKVRGIRVIMEIDAPAHAGNGWQWGPTQNLGNLAVCVNQQPWRSYCIQPPCGQLNPINDNLYPVLGRLYNDIIDLVPEGEAFHMGGDEVFVQCWNTTEEIIKYLYDHNKGRDMAAFLDLWGDFQTKAVKAYDDVAGDSSTPIILWSSHLTDPEVITKYLSNKRYVIQTWVPAVDPLPLRLLELGYQLIISTKDTWYLDHGFWGSTQYHNWQVAYNNRIAEHPNVLGGEACSWGELVDDSGTDSRVWPRTAAVAERLWSNPKTTHGIAQPRFQRHRERLITRGIRAEAIGPRWCDQNEGECQ